jgi:hypothetical protein
LPHCPAGCMTRLVAVHCLCHINPQTSFHATCLSTMCFWWLKCLSGSPWS